MSFAAQPDPAYAAMRDWMERWSDLEARLAALLLAPQEAGHFPARLQDIHHQADTLLALDADATLYWLFQLAASSPVGYSASHAMVCWALCRLVGQTLGHTEQEQTSLACAALTMNIAMTRLQDELANQTAPPTAEQRAAIDTHAARGAQWLRELGVRDAAWLQIVEQHHLTEAELPAPVRLLQAADRYAAMISPRETRPGRCVTDSSRHALIHQGHGVDDVGHALVRTVGICPPGSFVRLQDDRIAVVLRRSGRPAEPWVATVLDARGIPVAEPTLVDTGRDGDGIAAALVTQTVRVRLNHPRLLQLSRMALAQPR
ncbi:HD-GYP domain-containing protein [Tepidicella xavieri]|uniref:Phosphodiesterase n=1 Tax=Tepidicella xavieri TaxID=360241 RepID=A0A4R6UDF2_9BURK|nr:HD domain-containing phosphohydrolase [Tepidicella xavieri]TDQ43976.1 hypothetical protein DFR43_10458 [Tepidicella xavieri]